MIDRRIKETAKYLKHLRTELTRLNYRRGQSDIRRVCNIMNNGRYLSMDEYEQDLLTHVSFCKTRIRNYLDSKN